MEWALARDAQWLLVLNNDTVADPDCVRRLVEAARSDDRLGAVGPLIVRHDDPSRVWAAGGRLDFVRALGVHGREGAAASRVAAMPGRAWQECTFLTGCCLLLRPAAVREVGAFEERYFAYGEDAELSVRMARAGWRQGWVPAARLAHRVPAPGTPPRPDQIRLRDRNRRRLVRTHYTLPWRAAFALWFWPTRLVHLVRYALKGDRARARAIAAGMRES
jgi:GT2 family glycosyltransferase